MEPGARWRTSSEAGSRRVLVATPVTTRVARLVARTAGITLDAGLATTPARLPGELTSVRPHTLVVGANPVSAEAIRRWVGAMSSDGDTRRLVIVRRGTSLASVDVAAASAAGIDVVNTPGVNARHIAAFVAHRLLAATQPPATPIPAAPPRTMPAVGLLGAGNINGRVAQAAVAHGYHVVVFTPSLACDAGARRTWLHAHRLPPGAVTIAADVDDVFADAELVSIAVPLTSSGPHPTRGFVDAHHIKRFTGTRIVSVAEPDVFTDAALLEAYANPDLDVVLDNAPYLLDPVRRLVARTAARAVIRTAARTGIRTDTATGGGQDGLRAGFTLSSEAMRAPDCAADLDEAFLAVLATADMADMADIANIAGQAMAGRPLSQQHGPEEGIVVVGGGIVGLTVAFGLLAGGWRRLRVLDAGPADQYSPQITPRSRTPTGLPRAQGSPGGAKQRPGGRGSPDPPCNPAAWGTTFAGTNGRHLSATETLPHASPARAGALTRPADSGGWQLRDPATLITAERRWVEAFEERTDRPSLHALAGTLVVAVNRLGLHGWEAFVAAHPEVFTGLRWDARLTRAYPGAADFDHGRTLQGEANRQVRELDDDEVATGWPALRRDADNDDDDGPRNRDGDGGGAGSGGPRVHGFLEVDGYAVNIHDLAGALHDHLVASGVEIRSGARVSRITPAGPSVRLTLADGTPITADTAVVTTGGADLADLLGEAWPAARSVQGVLGVSVTVPNPGIHRPLKIHTPDPLGIVNITASPDGTLVHASGGFGFVGLARPADLTASAGIDTRPVPGTHSDIGANASLDASAHPGAGPGSSANDHPDTNASAARPLLRLLEDTLGRLFPALRHPDGTIDVVDRRTCIRPMTPDGVPVVEALDAFGGRVIVAAGTNAGGTVQAPALAALVAALLDGRAGPAHLALHGSRPSLGIPVPAPVPAG